MAANIIGVAVAGFVVVYAANNSNQNMRHFWLPGFCGGLTTFSSVMLLTHQLGFIYLMETLILSFLVIATVIPIARRIFEEQL